MWQQAFAAKYDNASSFGKEGWDQLMGHCQAVCDWPAIAFAQELIEAYPDAKIILTMRDVHTWHKSVLKTVDWRANDKQLKMLSNIDYASGLYYPTLRSRALNDPVEYDLLADCALGFWDVFFHGDFETYGKKKFVSHYDDVREWVRDPDRLLEFDIKEGWGPLCDFLQVPIPDEKFPHVNDGDHFVARCKARNRAQLKNVALRWVAYSVGLVFTMSIGRSLLYFA